MPTIFNQDRKIFYIDGINFQSRNEVIGLASYSVFVDMVGPSLLVEAGLGVRWEYNRYVHNFQSLISPAPWKFDLSRYHQPGSSRNK